MFRRATESIVQSCGEETLHAVTDLNSAERFKPLCLVEKKTSYWPFKRPTFIPTCVKITDLLQTPTDIHVRTREVTLLKSFKDVPTVDVTGSANAKVTEELQVKVKEGEKVKLVLKLGDIEKVEVSWEQLHDVLETTSFKCNDQVYKNARRSGRILCVVIESICTKCNGTLSEDFAVAGSADVTADAGKFVHTAIVPEVHTNGAVERREDESFILPPDTVLAYACVELSVGLDGFAKLHSTYDQLDGCAGEMLAEPTVLMKHKGMGQLTMLKYSSSVRNDLISLMRNVSSGIKSLVLGRIYAVKCQTNHPTQDERNTVLKSNNGVSYSQQGPSCNWAHYDPDTSERHTPCSDSFLEQNFQNGNLFYH